MTLKKITELKAPPVVGKFYLVPCVWVKNSWFPIIGAPHTDADLGVADNHYHHDLRFLNKNLLTVSLFKNITDEDVPF